MAEPDFIIIRHRKENLKKCSLSGFETDPRFHFYTYPTDIPSFLENFFEGIILLDIEGEELSSKDASLVEAPILIIDATWRYAETMLHTIPGLHKARRCRLPQEWVTAYPRKQTECPDPERGLASLEAMYIAALLLKKPIDGLLDNYYWKNLFLEKNKEQIEKLSI